MRWRSTAGCTEPFTDLSMRRVSATGIVDAAPRMLDEPVVLEDLAHQALAVAHGPDTTADLLQDWEQRSRHASAVRRHRAVGGDRGRPPRRGVGQAHRAARPRRRRAHRMVLERASAALALNRMIERDRSGLHQQAQSGLIDDVLRGRVTDEREIAARASCIRSAEGRPVLPARGTRRFAADAGRPCRRPTPQHLAPGYRGPHRQRIRPHRPVRASTATVRSGPSWR